MRQDRSRPLLEDFHAWLETESPRVLPKSDVRGAMDYTLSNWTALTVYCNDGWLDIDNNEGENAVLRMCRTTKKMVVVTAKRATLPETSSLDPFSQARRRCPTSFGKLP